MDRAPAPTTGDLELRWLVRLRWGALAAQLLLLVLISASTTWTIAWSIVLPVLVVTAVSNVVLGRVARHVAATRAALAVLLLDVALLTALLVAAGGPMNPFTLLYLVQVALASVTLAPRPAFVVTVVAVAAYAALFVLVPGHAHDHAHMALHLQGMWIATLVAGALIAFFVGRLRRDLAVRADEERRLRELESRGARLASLATLAGGAAHELATPLGTIAIAAEALAAHAPDDARADLALILAEVRRCKGILEQLAARGGAAAGGAPEPTTVGALVDAARADLPAADLEVELGDAGPLTVVVPRVALAAALRGLVKNALQARAPDTRVGVRAVVEGPHVAVVVENHGPTVAPEVLERIGEPFFTTKAPGAGMGLGVFLARTLAEQLGGALVVTSADARTTVRLLLPRGPAPDVAKGRAGPLALAEAS